MFLCLENIKNETVNDKVSTHAAVLENFQVEVFSEL